MASFVAFVGCDITSGSDLLEAPSVESPEAPVAVGDVACKGIGGILCRVSERCSVSDAFAKRSQLFIKGRAARLPSAFFVGIRGRWIIIVTWIRETSASSKQIVYFFALHQHRFFSLAAAFRIRDLC